MYGFKKYGIVVNVSLQQINYFSGVILMYHDGTIGLFTFSSLIHLVFYDPC